MEQVKIGEKYHNLEVRTIIFTTKFDKFEHIALQQTKHEHK